MPIIKVKVPISDPLLRALKPYILLPKQERAIFVLSKRTAVVVTKKKIIFFFDETGSLCDLKVEELQFRKYFVAEMSPYQKPLYYGKVLTTCSRDFVTAIEYPSDLYTWVVLLHLHYKRHLDIISPRHQRFLDFLEKMRQKYVRKLNENEKYSWALTISDAPYDHSLDEVFAEVEKRVGSVIPPAQRVAVSEMLRRKKTLLADKMGTGKTVMSLLAVEALYRRGAARRVLVIAPASVKEYWKEEAMRWLSNARSYAIYGTNGIKEPAWVRMVDDKAMVIVINYDIIRSHLEWLIRWKPDVLICDEATYIKNRTAKRTKAVLELKEKTSPSYVFALTGTPLLNRPREIFTLAALLGVKLLVRRGYEWYAARYCAAEQNGYGKNNDRGASNVDELGWILRGTTMIRRDKEAILKQLEAYLPAKRRSVLPVVLDETQKHQYKALERGFIQSAQEAMAVAKDQKVVNWLARASATLLARMEPMRQFVAKVKLKNVVKFVEDLLEEGEAEKVVVFCYHREIFKELLEAFKKYGVVGFSGGMDAREKRAAEKKFQTDPNTRVFVGTIRAARMGLNLQVANAVVFAELDWVPGDIEQAEDRVNRIGQTRDVNVYYFVAKNTIDDKFLLRTILYKSKIQAEFYSEDMEYDPEKIKVIDDRKVMLKVLAEYLNELGVLT